MELRRQTRYKIQVPVSFEWEGESGVKKLETGVTRNISVNGLHAVGPVAPPVGSRIRFTVSFPSLGYKPVGPSWPGNGLVIHQEPCNGEKSGFGVKATFDGQEA